MDRLLVFLCLLGAALAQIDPNSGLTEEEKKQFLDRHNSFRRSTAKKHKAQNMNELVWDDYLAKMAYDWAKNCDFSHGLPDGYEGDYGQNLYMTSGDTNKFGAVNIWYYEYKFYDFETGACDPGPCGHYTQLVWSSTKKVGCAHYQCPVLKNPSSGVDLKNAHHIVCQYDPPGNFDGRPILGMGKPCSHCPGGAGFCDDGLCVEKCPANSKKCSCNIECENCGTRDESTCSCKCSDGFTGAHCEQVCADKDDKCGKQYPPFLCTHPQYKPTMEMKCPKTCGICSMPDETWKCGNTTYAERFSPNLNVGYLAKHGHFGECIFPFTYKGVEYDRCTEQDSVYPEPWCGTEVESKQWGHCVPIKTYRGDEPGKECNFPFTYQYTKHYKCVGDDQGYYWCGLSDDYDSDQTFGYCDLSKVPEMNGD